MKINTFLETAGNFDERELLLKLHQGISSKLSENDESNIIIDKEYSQCDLSIIMGSWKPREKDHHTVRNSVVENSRCFMVVETALLGRKVFENNKYFRIGINGFLNNSGVFNHGNYANDRLSKLGISWNGWKNNPDGNILLFLQLPGDASLRGISIYAWAFSAIKKIRKHTNRTIVIRTHPMHNIKDTDEFYKMIADLFLENISNVVVSNGKTVPLDNDLSSAFCTVAYSSGSSIDSILAGIPTIAVDAGNFAFEVSSNFFEDINSPKKESERVINQWLNKLSYSQWTIEEMFNGAAWTHLRPLVDLELLKEPIGKKKSK